MRKWGSIANIKECPSMKIKHVPEKIGELFSRFYLIKSVLLKKQKFISVYMFVHVCMCTWKFYHLVCVLDSIVPDLRAGLMGTYSSNVGLLLIMSQNNLSKKTSTLFSKASVVSREVWVRMQGANVCESLCERMLSVAVFGSAASLT